MKYWLLLALLVMVVTAHLAFARGFGGRIGGDGSAVPVGDGIGGSGGLWTDGAMGAGGMWGDSAYASGLPWWMAVPGANVAYGGFFSGPPQLDMKRPSVAYHPLAGEQPSNVPTVETEGQRRQAFANQAAGMGIRMGGFQPSDFGPPPGTEGLPSDMGLHVAGGKSPAGFRGQGSVQSLAAELRIVGNAVRSAPRDYNVFDQAWFSQHVKAWPASSFVRDAWATPSWTEVTRWLGGDWADYQYLFGSDLVYKGNTVYLFGRPIASADKYYDSAVSIARKGTPNQTQSKSSVRSEESRWLPLGVYQATRGGEKENAMLFQLALGKTGVVRGNYFNPADKNVQLLEGAVDKETERVAWVVADRPSVVFDGLLCNLTLPETSMLVHLGKDKQEQWTFVRLKQKAGGAVRK